MSRFANLGRVAFAVVIWIATAAIAPAVGLQGAVPGATTKADLLAHEQWGEPAKSQTDDEGAEYLLYKKGRFNVVVIVVDGVVRTLDIRFPPRTSIDAVEKAFALGEPTEGATPPPDAEIGLATEEEWKPLCYPDKNVVVFALTDLTEQITRQDGNIVILVEDDWENAQVTLVRLYSPPPATGQGQTPPQQELPPCTTNQASEDQCMAGIDHMENGRGEEAMKCFAESIRLDPRHACPYSFRSEIELMSGLLEQGLADARKAAELAPEEPAHWSILSEALSMAGDFPNAITAANKAIELDPNQPYGYCHRATALLETGRSKEALADFDRAVQVAPNNPQGYICRGNLRFELDDINGAAQDAGKVIQLDAENTEGYRLRGECHEVEGEYQKAIADCTKALELDPMNYPAYFVRSNAYRGLGDSKRARADDREGRRLMNAAEGR